MVDPSSPNSGLNLNKPARPRQIFEELSGTVDFRHVYFLLLTRSWIIVLFVGICMAAGMGWVMRQSKIYQSRAVLQVQQQERQIVKIDGIMQDNPSASDFLNTIVQSLLSRNLMLRVIDANKLRENPAFVNPNNPNPPTDIQLADKLRGKVNVALRRGTRLIDITVEDMDPVMARDLAASIVKEFMRENFSQRTAVNRVASEFLQEEAEKLKKKLEESEAKLQRYKEQNQAVSLEERQNIIVERLRELSTKVTSAKGERLRLESDIEQVRAAGAVNMDQLLRIASVAQIPQVAEHRGRLLDAETEFAAMQDRYGSLHPKFIAASTRIESLKQALHENVGKAGDILNGQYEAAVQTETKLTTALKEQESTALELNKIAIPFNVLQRDVESDSALYQSVIKRMKETTMTVAVEQTPYTLVEQPMVASNPSKPNRSRTLAMIFGLSLFLAVGAVIFADGLDASLRSVDDAEAALQLPSLVGIPNYKPSKSRNSSKSNRSNINLQQSSARSKSHSKYPIATLDDPASSLAEAYRSLRASLSMLGPVERRQIVLFVSAIPEEGKTYTSLNTAVVLAQQKLKTLLIDADLRRPSLNKALLHAKETPVGLTDYFSGNTSLESIIHQTAVENLSLITAGHRAPNPAELLASTDLGALFNELLKTYDRIIIDSAPVNAVSDALVIAPHVHKTILVIRAGKTPRKAILRCVMLLKKAQATLGGFVLNRLPTGRAAGYYYYYYGDKYEKDSAYGSSA
jgi:succinoglycan biosynthesis transport protein ExoP